MYYCFILCFITHATTVYIRIRLCRHLLLCKALFICVNIFTELKRKNVLQFYLVGPLVSNDPN